jgi:TolA-binding protein
MKKSLFFISILFIFSLNLVSAEPSAFGAGDLTKAQPYGLTSSEKVLLENKKAIRKVFVKSNNQENEVDSLRERVDGLQTVIESLSRKSHKNKIAINKLNDTNAKNLKSSSEFQKRISNFSQANNQSILVNKKDLEKLKLSLMELSKILDGINNSYVSKKDFNSLVEDFNKFKGLVSSEFKNINKPKKSKFSGMKKSKIFSKAKNFFDKKFYTNAIEYYSYLLEKNYKPATSSYMIGEMNYRRKNYAKAISYFKRSAKLYSKASYMPSLMLHTAISMDKTGDKKNAKKFYNGVILKYPATKSANEAQNRLNKI